MARPVEGRAASRLGLASAAFALVVAAGALAPAHAQPRYREIAWPKGPQIVDHAVLDVNGDGHQDLLIVRGRKVELYLQEGGIFRPDRPHQVFNFVDKAILWTHADILGNGHPEILFLTGDGVFYYTWRQNHLSVIPRTLFKTTSILTTASREEVRLKDFYADLDGDGIPDLLLPDAGALVLYRGLGERRFGPAERLLMRPDVSVRTGSDRPTDQARSSFWYAQPRSADWNGDGLLDLFVYQRQEVHVFLQRKADAKASGPRFGPRPDHTMKLGYAGDLVDGRFKLDVELPTEFADLDGDGFADIVATHMGRAVTQIYRGRAGRADLDQTDRILRLNGITFLQFVVDLDGDGRQDLVLCRTDRPGLIDIVKVLITKEVPVELYFYYAQPDGSYPQAPDEVRALDIPILFSSARRGLNVGTSAVLTILGDFDGDGKRDLLTRSGAKRLSVYRGEGRRFAKDPAFHMDVSDMDGYRFLEPVAVDITGNGRSDLVLTYYSWDGEGDRLSVILQVP